MISLNINEAKAHLSKYLHPVETGEISTDARSFFVDQETAYLSAVPAIRLRHNIFSLSLEDDAASTVSRLSPLHNDSLDRMLIWQAVAYGVALLTPGRLIHQYHVNVKW